ncbi:LacI family DNA-binding transcriptional regulator [Aurantiacibacter xanthus]|uniref:LacI family DNA-binding transcriptional regulator n=1 Tax=Aurantiacibacter xanthus TaxID=1784712 RepID=A0A3A1P5X7_9SPHN|nr:LacI family DNA-binding transcriptional regulator [Aurantiacibacter xanthus]RIV86107.1 LacI family DNA-binding transcriptional regulator [Aurantiacibacter xanthus]
MTTPSQVPAGATIKDVAARAGVSPMTVSRVINNKPGVGQDTREKVEQAIAELSYTPNQAARRLVTSSEVLIGVIYSNPSAAFMSEFLTGVFEEASNRGVRLVLMRFAAGDVPTSEQLERFIGSGLSGLVLAPPLGESLAVNAVLAKYDLPVTAVGAYDVPNATCVRIDDAAAAFEMTQHLLDLGHRRLGFVLGSPNQAASARRMAGFHAAISGVEGVQVSLAQGDFSYASGLLAGELLLNVPTPPTAIFASSDDMAAAIVSVAHRRSLDVPGELSVVGFDDTTAAVTLWPELTTVHQPVRKLAAEALGIIVDKAQPNTSRQARPPRILEHSLIKRHSTAPIEQP